MDQLVICDEIIKNRTPKLVYRDADDDYYKGTYMITRFVCTKFVHGVFALKLYSIFRMVAHVWPGDCPLPFDFDLQNGMPVTRVVSNLLARL